MAFLEISGLKKRFGAVDILKGIDLELDKGGFLVLVGPSGCGKSTLLNTIAGLETITSGDIRIDGRAINGLHPSKRDIAMVFQSYALYPNMTVAGNIAFGMEIRGVPKEERAKAIKQVSDMLQIGHLLDRKPSQLSGGQRQRVALGRAIVREPAVFLMDEPLSNLDAKLRVQTRAEIARLHQRLQTTVVYVTHDQVEAMTMGTRIAVMSDGLLQQVGTPQVLYDTPANRFVAGFIGSPSMNFLEVTADNGRLVGPSDWVAELPGRLKNAVGAVNGRKLIAGFRPEHLEIRDAEGPSVTVPGKADVVEYLGNEELLHVTALGKDVVAIVDSDNRVKPGDVLQLLLPYTKLHLFDAESGASLISERESVAA